MFKSQTKVHDTVTEHQTKICFDRVIGTLRFLPTSSRRSGNIETKRNVPITRSKPEESEICHLVVVKSIFMRSLVAVRP